MVLRIAVLAVLVALLQHVADAAPAQAQSDDKVTVSQYNSKPNSGDGMYQYGFELSNGVSRYEQGELMGAPGKEELVVRGTFSQPGFDGAMDHYMYIADAMGYRVVKMSRANKSKKLNMQLIESLVG